MADGLWSKHFINVRAITMPVRQGLGKGILKMADVALFVAFFLACSFMYGLTAFLFRDQITRRDVRHRPASSINAVGPKLAIVASQSIHETR